MKAINLIIFIAFITFLEKVYAKEVWALDKSLSTIKFELPVLLAKNVNGEFEDLDGFVEIDLKKKNNNKAIFSVKIKSISINYTQYKDLLLSEIFFNENQYPIALIDTKKFSYKYDEEFDLIIELNIKGRSQNIPLKLKVLQLADDLVQIKGNLSFSRNSYSLGTGNWSSTAILKDKAIIDVNLFLFRN